MTLEEKDILMERMLDPDSVLSKEDLDLILHDPELRELYEVSVAVRGVCVQPESVDVEREWLLFRHRILPRPSRWRWVMRVAAIFMGVLFVAAVARVAVDRILTDDKPVVVAEVRTPVAESPVVKEADSEPLPAVEKHDTQGREAVAPPPRGRKRSSVKMRQEEEEIDVDEYLRLEQARIDNEVAIIQAELYIDRLQALREEPSPDEADELNTNEIRYVIMQ